MTINLDDWQKEVLETKGDILLCTGRRVGKTYIVARKAVDRMAKSKTPIVVVSLTEDQAMIIMMMALNYAKDTYPKQLIVKGRHKPTQRGMTFMNGSTMISRPVGNTGDGARGFEGGILIVDEASRIPKTFWIAAKPILLTTNGEIWICSTPHGKQGYFWKRYEEAYIKKEKDARFKVFYISTEQVVKDRKICSSWTTEQREGAFRVLREDKKEMTFQEYGQEYLGMFLDDIRQYFTDELIKECQTLDRPKKINYYGKLFLGVDVARLGRDESTFEVIDRTDKKNLLHIDHQILKEERTTQVTKKILQMENQYMFKQIFIDAYNVGVGVFDQLLDDKRTARKTGAINHFSRPLTKDEKQQTKITKEDIYENLKGLMERGEIKFLKGDDIFQSLKSMQYEYLDGGKMQIHGSYAHIADGLARAAYCSKDKSLNIFFYS